MKLTTYLSAAVLAAGLAASAGATTTLSLATGDLVLGFQTTGTGSTNNVEVDLGAFSTYQTAFNNSQTGVVVANLGADLTADYGADWNTRSNITWSFAGNLANSPTPTLFVSKVETVVGTQSAAFTASFSNSTLGNSLTAATSVAITGLNGKTSTANSDIVAILDSSLGQSYTAAFGTDNLGYRIFTVGDVANTTSITGGSYSVSDLYKVKASGAYTYVGSFGLDSAGVLTYSYNAASFSAVPEPSTYAAIFGGVVLGYVAYRRRRKAVAA